MNIKASCKKMRETSTRKQMKDQNTRDKYQQWINSWNSEQAYEKMGVKHPIKIEWKREREKRGKYESMKEKIRQMKELQITEQELGKTTIKRKNWSTPGE